MNADAYKKIMTLSRIACFIALQCALPAGNTAFAREYFNPALLGIDGREKSLPIFPLLKKASAKCLAPIVLTSL